MTNEVEELLQQGDHLIIACDSDHDNIEIREYFTKMIRDFEKAVGKETPRTLFIEMPPSTQHYLTAGNENAAKQGQALEKLRTMVDRNLSKPYSRDREKFIDVTIQIIAEAWAHGFTIQAIDEAQNQGGEQNQGGLIDLERQGRTLPEEDSHRFTLSLDISKALDERVERSNPIWVKNITQNFPKNGYGLAFIGWAHIERSKPVQDLEKNLESGGIQTGVIRLMEQPGWIQSARYPSPSKKSDITIGIMDFEARQNYEKFKESIDQNEVNGVSGVPFAYNSAYNSLAAYAKIYDGEHRGQQIANAIQKVEEMYGQTSATVLYDKISQSHGALDGAIKKFPDMGN